MSLSGAQVSELQVLLGLRVPFWIPSRLVAPTMSSAVSSASDSAVLKFRL